MHSVLIDVLTYGSSWISLLRPTIKKRQPTNQPTMFYGHAMDSFDTQAVCYGDMTNARRMGTRTFNDLMDVMTEAIGSEGDRVTVVMTGEQRFTQDLATSRSPTHSPLLQNLV